MRSLDSVREEQLKRKAEQQELESHFSQLWNQGYTYRQIAQKMGITFSKSISLRQKLKLTPRMTSRYSIEGKIQQPLSDQDFQDGMNNGYFVASSHRAFCILLYYSAVRKAEALRATRNQFDIRPSIIYFSVGKRLKHGIETPSLPLPLSAPFMSELQDAIEAAGEGERVFPYSLKTGYNIVRRAFKYPHLFRLSRITNFFDQDWSIAQVHSWTGLTLKALDYYIGLVDVKRMGESLAKKQRVEDQEEIE